MFRGYWIRPGIEPLGHHFGGIGIAAIVLMIILWAAVMALIVIGIRALIVNSRRNKPVSAPGAVAGSHPSGVPAARSAADASSLQATLEGRYSRGEIGRDEFLQYKRDLGLAGSVASPTQAPAADTAPPPGAAN
jgi:uncharacterized membrane protein